jgi:glutaminase
MAPNPDPGDAAIETAVQEAHKKYQQVHHGKNASYIPYLAQVPSHLFGVAVVTVGGKVVEAGDTRFEFAIESISKVLSLALVMEEIGPAEVRSKVGARPTGLPFNSVIAVELHKGKPLTPLVNAGAMSVVSLVKAASAEERWLKVLDIQGRFAGRPIRLNERVYHSESSTNYHNRGIAWLLYSYGTMYSDPMEACDVYTKQCSTAVTAQDLAVAAATLAADGVNPVTQRRVVAASNVPHILAEMTMEGLYEGSGDWAYTVGLPGKSGVGGGILCVVPGHMGIAAFAPPLDEAGNSVRGQMAIRHVAHTLNLNLYYPPRAAR